MQTVQSAIIVWSLVLEIQFSMRRNILKLKKEKTKTKQNKTKQNKTKTNKQTKTEQGTRMPHKNV